ncbi:MAG: GNAT family N-acetyltransferase, partial [Ktedonobacterales bacterium]
LYLYDFATLEAWRGRGCYPALLQRIIVAEPASDFWIIHHITNSASRRGIARAGFHLAGIVCQTAAGGRALLPSAAPARARAGAALLNLPLLPVGPAPV